MPLALSDPLVHEIVTMRRHRYVALSLLVSTVYVVVAIGCAFAPDLMRHPIYEGSAISVGILSMVFIMLVGITSSGYYTWWSNTVRDRLISRVIERGTQVHG